MKQDYDGADRREFERTEVDEAAIIVFPDGATRLPCKLLNRSDGGVLLTVSATESLPVEFTLLTTDPDTVTVCRIAWRIGARTGCEYIAQLTAAEAGDNLVLPLQSECKEKTITSRLLKHPIIIG